MKGSIRPLWWIENENMIAGQRRITSVDDKGRRYEKVRPFVKMKKEVLLSG